MEGGRPRAQLTSKLTNCRGSCASRCAGVNVLETAAGNAGRPPADDLRSSLALATPAILESAQATNVGRRAPEAARSGSQAAISERLARSDDS